jgi:hypothetical protein
MRSVSSHLFTPSLPPSARLSGAAGAIALIQKWFAVTYSHACEVMIRWSKFMLLRPYIGRKLKNALCLQLSNVKDEVMYVKLETLGAFWDKAVSAMPLDDSKYLQEATTTGNLSECYIGCIGNIQSWTRSVGGTVYPTFVGVLRREVSLMSLDIAFLPYSHWHTFLQDLWPATSAHLCQAWRAGPDEVIFRL